MAEELEVAALASAGATTSKSGPDQEDPHHEARMRNESQ